MVGDDRSSLAVANVMNHTEDVLGVFYMALEEIEAAIWAYNCNYRDIIRHGNLLLLYPVIISHYSTVAKRIKYISFSFARRRYLSVTWCSG